MHRPIPFVALWLLLFLCSFHPVRAQKAATSPESEESQAIHVATRNVLLDVVVTDKDGNLVNDLKKEDFLIFEDKQPQTILSFERPEDHFLPPNLKPADIQSMADVQRKLPNAPITILVLDELNTHFEDMAYARYTLNKYLKSLPVTMPQPTSLLVAANRSFFQLHDYTLDRDALIKALADHKSAYPFKMMYNGHGGAAAIDSLASTLTVMQQISRATTGHPGRKNMIWVGRGFMSIDLSNEADTTEAAIRGAVQQTINQLRDARVTLTSIDPTQSSSTVEQVITPDDLAVELDSTGGDPFGGDVNFTSLGPDTGGRAVYTRNDVGVQIGNAIHEGGNYYSLSYSPSNKSDTEQKYRSITVALARPGLTATTRNGYYTGVVVPTRNEPLEHPAENLKTLAQDLNTAITTTLSYTGLKVRVQRDRGTGYKVIVGSRDIAWKTAENGDRSAEVTIVLAAFSRQNKLMGQSAREMTAGIPAAKVSDLMSHDLGFLIPGQTQPGSTRVRIVVRDAGSGKIGTVDLDTVTGETK